jgi:hypothetical protein
LPERAFFENAATPLTENNKHKLSVANSVELANNKSPQVKD